MSTLVEAEVVIVGAGAAGLLCAIECGKRGRRAVVIEHNAEIGRKILISGGGRCNFTNVYCAPEHFLSANPHFVKSALARYRPSDFIALLNRHRIPYHEKKLGQMFCDRSARDVVAMLRAECHAAGVEIHTGCVISKVEKPHRFLLETNLGSFAAPSLVVATGGLSIPKIGATPFAYRIAGQFGIRVTPTRPALVPLLVPGHADLSGVSTEVIASTNGCSFRENLLFTHRGLSGPAILQISSYWDSAGLVTIDFVAEALPKRLAKKFPGPGVPWRVQPTGTEGYEKAEVTAGGIDTTELSSKTFECAKVPGLYFIGEAVDVTGQLGGFNFQWAWASGYCAGQFA